MFVQNGEGGLAERGVGLKATKREGGRMRVCGRGLGHTSRVSVLIFCCP
jgi:hypothetical protein